MGSTVYQQYAKIFQALYSSRGDVGTLFDDDNGLALHFKNVCAEVVAAGGLDDEVEQAWQLERDTWQLVHDLYGHRLLDSEDPVVSADDLLAANPYAPPLDVMNALSSSSKPLQELQLVIQWLQDTAPTYQYAVDDRRRYWPITTRRELHKVRLGDKATFGLDPDATLRGLTLENEDASDEKSLARALFMCIRAGTIEDAISICKAVSQPWRAASLLGGMPFEYPALSDLTTPLTSTPSLPPKGNRHRTLWKRTCLKLARTESVDPYERATYGALIGDVKSVREVCRTWEDHLWARLTALLAQVQDKAIRELEGWWLTSGSIGSETPLDGIEDVSEDLLVIFDEIAGEKDMSIPSQDPYRAAQRGIIRNGAIDLLDAFASFVQDDNLPTSPPLRNQLVSFFAHLTLFLKFTNALGPEADPAQSTILEAYCRVLEMEGETSLVALYAGAIPKDRTNEVAMEVDTESWGDNGQRAYSEFLSRMNDEDTNKRRTALLLAKTNNLDLVIVANGTVDIVMRESQLLRSPLVLTGPEPEVTSINQSLTASEGSMVDAMDWLIFDESTWGDALIRSNWLLRFFLLHGWVHTARHLIRRLPPALVISEESEAVEFAYHSRLIAVIDALTTCEDLSQTETVHESNAAREGRIRTYSESVLAAEDKALDFLKTNWMVPLTEGEDYDDRKPEYARLRQMYIPHVVLRIHDVLCKARGVVKDALKKAQKLSNLLVDSRYDLYRDFITPHENKIPKYLDRVREVALTVLEEGGTDPFIP